MTTEEKISKTVASIKQVSFGRVSEHWLDGFKQGMEIAIEAEAMEQKCQDCKNCLHYRAMTDACTNEHTGTDAPIDINFIGCNYWKEIL